MDKISFVVGDEIIFNHIDTVKSWPPFDNRVVDFCDKLSKGLLACDEGRKHPELLALAFWLRKRSVERIKSGYIDCGSRVGKGVVFHIAPGNVALSFAYSLITGLLTGNVNVIRMPSRKFEQADLFCNVLNSIIEECPEMKERICLIRYPHDKDITDDISSKCNMRIIWGGDNTINTIRQSPIPPRASEVTFADRFSVCIIDADEYLASFSPGKVAHDFFIDTYLTDQNACSSPRIVFWKGQAIEEAKKVFWKALEKEISDYYMAPVTMLDKMLIVCKYASDHPGKLNINGDYRIMRFQIEKVDPGVLNYLGNSGLFYECDIDDIQDILPICTWKLQTVSYLGFDEKDIELLVLSGSTKGIDRILPIGKTMEFSFISDGHDMIREMTREPLVY